MQPVIDEKKCVGCLACELACAYHHTGAFDRADSSLCITFDEEYRVTAKVRESCDGCTKEPEPLCVEFCPADAVAMRTV